MQNLGAPIAEGKTKKIYQSPTNPDHVVIVSKDSISAGNGAKKDELPGKGVFSTITTCNIFRLLHLSGIPTHLVSQESADSITVLKCDMIPLEVIVRRVATGSYLKRFPDIKEGTRFEQPVVEFTFKDDILGDPLISDDEIIAKNLVCNGLKITTKEIEQLKDLARKSFLILEKAWQTKEVALVDFKVEFGVTKTHNIILADVIDNDSWRIWPKGDKTLMKDKQVYRNFVGKLTEDQTKELVENYRWAADTSAYLLDSILTKGSQAAPIVGIVMGSQSDWETMRNSSEILQKLGIPHETKIVSAHRTPERLFEYAKTAAGRGLRVIIAGAGGAAHLPGMVSSLTRLPVLGVPVQSRSLNGMDSLLSIVQMPAGVPVGTLAIGTAGAVNAGLLAASILCGEFPEFIPALENFRKSQTEAVAESPVGNSQEKQEKIVPEKKEIETEKRPKKEGQWKLEKILPGKILGIVGGGQLAKMIAQSATQFGFKVHIYCPDKASPAFQCCTEKTIGEYDNKESLSTFARSVDVITYEFENIPVSTLSFLDELCPVRPDKDILGICQHRIKEKNFVNSVGIPTTKYRPVSNLDQLKSAVSELGLPAILKTNMMGYDGKGQIFIRQGDDLGKVWEQMKQQDSILEAFVDFQCEISVIVGRGFDGISKTFPVSENSHSNHVLHKSRIPAQVSDFTRKEAEKAALKIAEAMKLIGLLAVEMFVTKEGTILVNEMAPRPHNSGHWTIEGCITSQFEQLVRAITGFPLGKVELAAKEVEMINLLGKEVEDYPAYMNSPNTHVHLYGKDRAAEGRKMGHVTILRNE